ncbi:gas vesicle protein GvpN [Prosthecomicrobium pneumaticum]|uniref:Gas vesicle protein GvpN n=1 Tax=Prosthecomicrobium pneumaticum TaxID=81895 RepID=A0A7W9FJC3_9HYPH|nr:gas vesicle protein GvpN [Prosthecomicrobium pneumaticum]MBB5751375.1 gas vesicle protein GvpN [Prosthecomicrobium pneumaticum]
MTLVSQSLDVDINGAGSATLPAPARSSASTLAPRPRSDFVETGALKDLTRRGLSFLRAGYPLHFRGPAGTGKTTLALHVAAQLGRPVILISGDNELGTADLIGSQRGYHYRKVVDRFIHSVTKLEETANQQWTDHRLTTACREGYTLVYDEFTRSRPETHNVLLGVFEEKMLFLPAQAGRDHYIRVHPDFRAIFTSNPLEYAGVHSSQDALADRLATIDVDYPEREMEVAVAAARSGLPKAAAARIVDLVRAFRASENYVQTPTLRSSLMIARVAALEGYTVAADDPRFVQLCLDALESRVFSGSQAKLSERQERRTALLALVATHCPAAGAKPVRVRATPKAVESLA